MHQCVRRSTLFWIKNESMTVKERKYPCLLIVGAIVAALFCFKFDSILCESHLQVFAWNLAPKYVIRGSNFHKNHSQATTRPPRLVNCTQSMARLNDRPTYTNYVQYHYFSVVRRLYYFDVCTLNAISIIPIRELFVKREYLHKRVQNCKQIHHKRTRSEKARHKQRPCTIPHAKSRAEFFSPLTR